MNFKVLSNRVNFRSKITPVRFFYDARSKNDTIFAPATNIQPQKGSPLGIIRVAGNKTEQVVHQLTKLKCIRQETSSSQSRDNFKKKFIRPRYATVGNIVDPTNDDLIDIGMIVWFPKPNSYTGDDVCELHLHGSRAITSRVLNILGAMDGLRPAEPGEFTRRAVINGKISILQAESLPDLIASQTEFQRKFALSGLDGTTRKKYDTWSENLIKILAHLEASIDFGEDELIGEKIVVEDCLQKLKNISEEVSLYIKISSKRRELVQTGFRAVILGRPNAGKSTFMNLLCGKDKSIVSDLKGTTRDVVEHSFEFCGHAITLCDTAGLRDLNLQSIDGNNVERSVLDRHNSIEKEGIKRALEVACNADVVLYLVDGSKFIGEEREFNDVILELKEVLSLLNNDKDMNVVHLIINKVDLNDKLLSDKIIQNFDNVLERNLKGIRGSFISCITEKNLDSFVQDLTTHLNKFTNNFNTCETKSKFNHDTTSELNHVSERHLSLLKSVEKHLRQASKLDLDTIDEMAQHVRESLDYLSRIVGSVTNEQVLDVIFRDFCIGK